MELSKNKILLNIKHKLYIPSSMFNLFKRYKSISFVLISNIIALGIGAILSFLVPYLLSINEYGHYKQFTLYLSYVGLMHFGFNDGIYLEYGAYNYEDLDKCKFRMYFRYLLFQQLFSACLLFLITFFLFKDSNRFFIFSFVCLNMVLLNLAKYFSYISQITKRFVLYGIGYLVEKTALIIPILFLFMINLNIRVYLLQFVILSQTVINTCLILFFIYIYKDIVFGNKELFNKKDIKKILSLGCSLMLGNFILIMIFNIDRFMIDVLLPLRDFSIYSLAVQFLSVILVFITSISMFIYPYLKRKGSTDYKAFYEKMGYMMFIFSCIALTAFFPIKYLITAYLPQYKDSIPIFLILLPGVTLRGEIDIVFNNLFKSLKKQKVYFRISILILILSVILNLVFYQVYHSVYAFSMATLLTFICWYIISDLYLCAYYKLVDFKKYFCLVLLYGNYFLSTFFNNFLFGFMLYLFLIIILLFLVSFRVIKKNKSA